MPTISLYIRDADYAAWQKIQNKSEWLSNKLKQAEAKLAPVPIYKGKATNELKGSDISLSEAYGDPPEQPKPKSGLESLRNIKSTDEKIRDQAKWTGPIFRDSKKGKI